MTQRLLRMGVGALSLALLLSCGGGETDGETFAGSTGVTANGSLSTGQGEPSAGGDGPGAGGSTGSDGSTSTAANGDGSDDGSGVGSGGTGVSTADSGTSVGSVDGMGSIFVGGLRYDIDQAQIELRDAVELQLGMSVAVTGPMDEAFATGTARSVVSMAQMRGVVSAVDVPGGTFQLMGSSISVDENTVWADLNGLGNLVVGSQAQVWALPISPGQLRATRIESKAVASSMLLTGSISQLDFASQTFQLGGLTVDFRLATSPADGLADGRIVRVTATAAPAAGRLEAIQVERSYVLPNVEDAPVQLEGVITDFSSTAAFVLMGTTIDAATAQVTGGQAEKLGNGVTVVASGTLSDAGVLVASKLKIRHIPGGGALPSFHLIGPISNFNSAADMMVRGQRVDASAAAVVGTGQLANGVRVRIEGSEVISGVLQVTQLSFE